MDLQTYSVNKLWHRWESALPADEKDVLSVLLLGKHTTTTLPVESATTEQSGYTPDVILRRRNKVIRLKNYTNTRLTNKYRPGWFQIQCNKRKLSISVTWLTMS